MRVSQSAWLAPARRSFLPKLTRRRAFARLDVLDSLSSERRSIDVAGVGASGIARLAMSSGFVSDISLRRMENQKDWQEGQLRIKRRTSSTASFARVSE